MLAILVIQSAADGDAQPPWVAELARSGARLLFAAGEREALRVLRVTGEVAAVLLERDATGISPSAFAQALRATAVGPSPELWVVVGDDASEAAQGELLAGGADGVVRRSGDSALLLGAMRAALARAERLRQLHAAHLALTRTQLTDAETGLYNGRYLRMRLGEELERSVRERRPLSVMMVELPVVLDVEEQLGHEPARELLRLLVARTRQVLRSYDVFCRVANHRFAVLLPDAEPTVAAGLAQRLSEALHGQPAAVTPQMVRPISLRVALAGFVEGSAATSPGRLLQRLEQAVAQAGEGAGPVVCRP